MLKFKKVIATSLSVFLVISSFQLKVFAKDENNINTLPEDSLSYIQTSEESIPFVTKNDIITYSLEENADTLSVPSREIWSKNTKSILEDTYSQKVSDILEDDDFITFEFEISNDLDPTEEHIMKVEYIKPESTLATENYDTKITYTWGWKKNFFEYDSKSGKWSSLKNLGISIVGASSIPVANFLASAYSGVTSTFKSDQQVQVDSLYKAYYLNETCHVKESLLGYWLPYCFTGCRKDFMAGSYTTYDSYGQPFMNPPKEITVGKPSSNPTNYDRIKKSSHFDDINWMTKRAIELYKMDGLAHNEVIGYPDTPFEGNQKP
jgi:hypothetical protein